MNSRVTSGTRRCASAFRGLLLASAILSSRGLAAAADCIPVSVGVDTSQATSSAGVRCGAAPGETFLAADTLIRSIVVWRPAIQTPSGASYKLWITGVDSAGTPDKYRVVLEGPVVTVPFGDGVHPIKIEFSFDPPFALPGLGRYFFAVQDYCGSHFDLLTSLEDAYAEGSLWRTGISCLDGCSYLGPLSRLTASDLVFTIEFCGDTATTVRRNSWGRLKILYR